MRDFITGRLPHTGLGEPPTWMKAKDLKCVCARKGVGLLCNKGVGSTLVQTGELYHWKNNSHCGDLGYSPPYTHVRTFSLIIVHSCL